MYRSSALPINGKNKGTPPRPHSPSKSAVDSPDSRIIDQQNGRDRSVAGWRVGGIFDAQLRLASLMLFVD